MKSWCDIKRSRFEVEIQNPNWLRNQSQQRPQVFPLWTGVWELWVTLNNALHKTNLMHCGHFYFENVHTCVQNVLNRFSEPPQCVWEIWVTYTHSAAQVKQCTERQYEKLYTLFFFHICVCKIALNHPNVCGNSESLKLNQLLKYNNTLHKANLKHCEHFF